MMTQSWELNPELDADDQSCDVLPLLQDEQPAHVSSANRLAFGLFILINATLFLRPAEIVPGLAGWPIYEVLNLLCMGLCLPQLTQILSRARLATMPIVACVVGLQFSVILSDLSHLEFARSFSNAVEFAKILAYFLMLVALVDSPRRLRSLLFWLMCFTSAVTAMALLHFHGIVNIPAMAAAREIWSDNGEDGGVLLRLCAAGLFGNPNDLARILVVGMLLALYWASAKVNGPSRVLWIGPFLMMGYALQLTHSRGGLLALMAGIAILFKMRFGWFKSFIALAFVAPVVLIAFAGRQMELNTSSGTGQQRIQLWAEGLNYLRSAPLFGIGMNRYQEYIGLAAHNSFVQCFVDLGFVGGTLFMSANVLAIMGIHQAREFDNANDDEILPQLRPYMMAIVVSAVVGMFSSTRSYIIPTYATLGIAICYLNMLRAHAGEPQTPLNWTLVRRLCGLGIASVLFIYLWVRLFAVWE